MVLVVQLQTKGVYAAVQGEAYTLRALGEHVVKVVKQFSAGRSQHDDIALVGFGRTDRRPTRLGEKEC